MATRKGKGGKMETEAEASFVTTIRLRPDQWEALRLEAMKRATAAEPGNRRADASAIIRELVDGWMRKRK